MVASDGISAGALSEYHYLQEYCKKRMEYYMSAKNAAERRFMQEWIENEMEKEMCFYSTDDMTVVMMAVNDRDEKEGEKREKGENDPVRTGKRNCR